MALGDEVRRGLEGEEAGEDSWVEEDVDLAEGLLLAEEEALVEAVEALRLVSMVLDEKKIGVIR